MSTKTTQKAVKNNYINVICVGYCELQKLLSYNEPIAYTTCRKGWGADVYYFGATAIVTGYKPFGNVKPTKDVCKGYDIKAHEILTDYSISHIERKTRMNNLLGEFIKEVTSLR